MWNITRLAVGADHKVTLETGNATECVIILKFLLYGTIYYKKRYLKVACVLSVYPLKEGNKLFTKFEKDCDSTEKQLTEVISSIVRLKLHKDIAGVDISVWESIDSNLELARHHAEDAQNRLNLAVKVLAKK